MKVIFKMLAVYTVFLAFGLNAYATEKSIAVQSPALDVVRLAHLVGWYLLANSDLVQAKPDCIATEPGPGNPCYCFYNGREFRCLKKEGRPGNDCSYHKDCEWGNPVLRSGTVPTFGLTVPNWHVLSL